MLIQPPLINAQPGDPNGDLRTGRSPHHERARPHKQDKDQHRTPLNDIHTDEEIANNCRHRHPQYFTAANAGPENDELVSWRRPQATATWAELLGTGTVAVYWHLSSSLSIILLLGGNQTNQNLDKSFYDCGDDKYSWSTRLEGPKHQQVTG